MKTIASAFFKVWKNVFPDNRSKGQNCPLKPRPLILQSGKAINHPYLFSYVNQCSEDETREKNNQSNDESSKNEGLLRNKLSQHQSSQHKFANVIKRFCKILSLLLRELHPSSSYQNFCLLSRMGSTMNFIWFDSTKTKGKIAVVK